MRRILVMAAGGNQGRLLLPRLRDAGWKVRAFRETPGREEELLALGASEVISGDATDKAVLVKALEGVDTVYHIGPSLHPQEFEMGVAMVNAATEVGVGHFIYSSVLHSIASKLIQHKLKRDIEERIVESWLDFTILQPGDYMVPAGIWPAFESGTFEWLFNADSPHSMVDLHDFADVVVKVVTEREKHFGATYELCAPGPNTANDVGRVITEVTGRHTNVHVPPAAEWSARIMAGGSGPKTGHQDLVIRTCELWYGRFRFLGNPNVLRWLLEREPTTLKGFVAREWEAYKAQNNIAG